MADNFPASKNRRTAASTAGNGTDGQSALYSLPTLYRGIYNRVAEKVGCDPSYVSCVARGERTSQAVARALEVEIRHTLAVRSRRLNRLSSWDGASRASTAKS
jgi:hypothetical protein